VAAVLRRIGGTPPRSSRTVATRSVPSKASRRVYIPKPDGRERPLGIAALEDKVVQRAVVEVLNAIYEVDFLGFSYGFRAGRNQQLANVYLHYVFDLWVQQWRSVRQTARSHWSAMPGGQRRPML
jgi:hypothetical protein